MDLIGACRGERDEQILHLRMNGATQSDIAAEVGFTQSSVSRRLASMLERAESKLNELSVRMRDRSHNLFAPPEEIPPLLGLRFAKHSSGHRDCCPKVAA